MACVTACPSSAISMIPEEYPPQQPKNQAVVAALRKLGVSKVRQERIAEAVAASADDVVQRQFADAVAKSNRLMAEDILRETGYMLPQSSEVRALLEAMIANAAPDFPNDAAELLLTRLTKAI